MNPTRRWCGALAALALVAGLCSAPASGANWTDYSTALASNRDVIVDAHNAARRNVDPTATNMLKMEWHEPAAAAARKWAKTCSFFHRDAAQMDLDGIPCSENMVFSVGALPWDNVFSYWRDEVDNPGFVYGIGAQNPGMVGHYTQVVWYSTYQVGCALNYCPNESPYKHIYVCQYCPGGNLKSRLLKPYEEGPSCQDCPNDCDNKLCTNPCPYVDTFANCWLMEKILGCGDSFFGRYTLQYCPATCQCTSRIN